MDNIPDRFYRVSIKALVLNADRDKFLICKKDSGLWEFPGGGLDWGADPQTDLKREISEEMGVGVLSISEHPSYFVTAQSEPGKGIWIANVLYETVLQSLDFIPSEECTEIAFVNQGSINDLAVFEPVKKVAELFHRTTQ